MNKGLLTMLVVSCGLSFVGNASASTYDKVNAFPSPDVITVTLAGVPNNDSVSIAYFGSNGVNISGPSSSTTANRTFQVQIDSDNMIQDGEPFMVLHYNNFLCRVAFVDGPGEVCVQNAENQPSSCTGFTVTGIHPDGGIVCHHNYNFTASYTG